MNENILSANHSNPLSETACLYSSDSFEKVIYYHLIINNCKRILDDVYRFKNFDEFEKQFGSDNINNRTDVYWNTVLYQYLMDHIKISLVFENFNKLILLQQGYLIHIPEENFNKAISMDIRKGKPVSINQFLKHSAIIEPDKDNFEIRLKGFTDNSKTISYSFTLNNKYQKIISLEPKFIENLKAINEKRNILHFYVGPSSGCDPNNEIQKWKYIKDTSYQLIESKLKEIDSMLEEW